MAGYGENNELKILKMTFRNVANKLQNDGTGFRSDQILLSRGAMLCEQPI